MINNHNFKTSYSRLENFSIIESTLREGEQFANAFFTTEEKLKIAEMLCEFGVEYIELTSPCASQQSFEDCKLVAARVRQLREESNGKIKTKTLTHTRCHMDDAKVAIQSGVDGIDCVFGTSSHLREFSHGKDIPYIIEHAKKVVTFIKQSGKEVRFSSEDSFRSNLVDLLTIYQAVDQLGLCDRVGIADTVGIATPRQVYKLCKTVRSVVNCDIEIHLHNDTGCAVANAFCALEAGVSHVDTAVLGIGERNGITNLTAFVARMYTIHPEYIKSKYNLKMLRELENYVANVVSVNIPFNSCVTGFTAFTHKAGIHAKAVINNPGTYEILNPLDFGMTRFIHVANRLTGWNAIKNRVEQLGLEMTDDEVKAVTRDIKNLCDIKPLSLPDIDQMLKDKHGDLKRSKSSGDLVENGKPVENGH